MTRRVVLALGATFVLVSCVALRQAQQGSPACAGLDSAIFSADAQMVAQLSADLTQGALAAALTAFLNAHGPQQAECVFQMAEILLGSPPAPAADAGPMPTPLQPSQPALVKLRAVRAALKTIRSAQ